MWNRILTFLAWTGLWQPPIEVFNRGAPITRTPLDSSQLLNLTSTFMTSLLEGYATENGRQVDYKNLKESVFFQQGFGQLGSLLQSADPLLLQPEERKTLFLNLYNLLTIHSIASNDPLPSSTISVPQFWRRYAYQVGPYTLHLDDMEHGILRGNRPHPTTGDTMFPTNDPRLALALPADHRIHGALNCGALSCPPLLSFEVDQLEQQLDDNFHKFCNGSVKLLSDNSLLINSIFQWFRVDFGSTEGSVLEFLAEQVDDPTITQALVEASRGQRRFNYNYDWTLNADNPMSKVKKVDCALLPPCAKTVHKKLQRAHYISILWGAADTAIPDDGVDPQDFGWKETNGCLTPVRFEGPHMPDKVFREVDAVNDDDNGADSDDVGAFANDHDDEAEGVDITWSDDSESEPEM